MARSSILERNMLALSSMDPVLSVALGKAPFAEDISLIPAASGHIVPAVNRNGKAAPLHSTVDPVREGRRFFDHQAGGGFLLFLGFAGGYHIAPFLEREDVSGILIIEERLDYLKTIFSGIDLKDLILDTRVQWLVPVSTEEVRQRLLDSYLPAVSGDLRLLPLRPRINSSRSFFDDAASVIRDTIDNLSEDYSVQSYFGKRWFTNSVRNLEAAGNSYTIIPPARKAVVTGAGPGLETSLSFLKSRRKEMILIATDTSLPFLLKHDTLPDMVISIDCQHITYHHFMMGFPEQVPLVLDLASPVFLSRLSKFPMFFTSGHPFSQYVNGSWRKFPFIDTSGGNVSHAAVSLAYALGAEEIHIYGADFSYPQGKSYARGTYLYPFFHSHSNRLSPAENRFADFIFHNESLTKEHINGSIRYTTRPMVSYRNRLSILARELNASVMHHAGDGLCIDNEGAGVKLRNDFGSLFSAGKSNGSWQDFILNYKNDLNGLPDADVSFPRYMEKLDQKHKSLCLTLFPACAAIRREFPDTAHTLPGARILNEARRWTADVISAYLP